MFQDRRTARRAEEKSPRHRATTLAAGGLVLLLALMGMGGIVFETFHPDGWLPRLAGPEFRQSSLDALLGLAITLWAAVCLMRWFDALDGADSPGDVPLYVAVGLGLFFTFELAVTGTV